jgi:serine/threonine protein kinase
MALSAGKRLGPYEILEPLGAGGMGEVYRARDPRLKRDVALKVLPEDLASEPERLERFEREAQTLAALNHPHIVTIFSVEEAENLRFLTMELLEGKTLTRTIPRGGFPLSRFFPIAIQLTEAVNAAHEKGIIHRDLKPGNVMVMEEDRVKVLDFGLAKLREGVRDAADTQSPTEPATGPGRILGTAPYMSPEQVQGKALDHRSDVFSLGVILYEMTTGGRPFGGDTFAEVASSILRDTPRSVTELRSDLPRDVARLVKHCLEKEPKRRFQTVLDLRNELEELKYEADSGALFSAEQVLRAVPPRRRPRWLGAAAALVILGIAVAGGWLWSSRGRDVPKAPLEITPFTSDGGLKRFPQLSPNGEKVAYAWAGPADDNWDIYVKALGVGTKPLRLTEDPAVEASPTSGGSPSCVARSGPRPTRSTPCPRWAGRSASSSTTSASPSSGIVVRLSPGPRTASRWSMPRGTPRTSSPASSSSFSKRSRSGCSPPRGRGPVAIGPRRSRPTGACSRSCVRPLARAPLTCGSSR